MSATRVAVFAAEPVNTRGLEVATREAASIDAVGFAGTVVTVPDAVHVTLPPGPVALPVYVIAVEGVTVELPFKGSVKVPWKFVSVNEVAFDVAQVSLRGEFGAAFSGSRVIEQATTGTGAGL